VNWTARWAALAAILAAGGCSGADSTELGGAAVTALTLPDTAMTLQVGNTVRLSALATRRSGATQPTTDVVWSSADSAVASVSAQGLVEARAAGTTRITARNGLVLASLRLVVARLGVNTISVPDTLPALLPGDTARLSGSAIAGTGQPLPEWPLRFSSEDSTVATVTRDGLVRAVGAGTTRLRIRADTVEETRRVQVVASADLAAAGLTLVQSIQNDSGTVPLIRGGLPILVNVYLTSDQPVRSRGLVRATCQTSSGAVWTDSARLDRTLGAEATVSAPGVQLLMPADRTGDGIACSATVTSESPARDRDSTNNRVPRVGTVSASLIDVPPMDLVMVPVLNITRPADLTPANLADYTAQIRAMLPVSGLTVRIGPPLLPSRAIVAGTEEEWLSLLSDLSGYRSTRGYTGYVQGVVPFDSTTRLQVGGYAFIGGYVSAIPDARRFGSALMLAPVAAHELGHVLGRYHAPCGGAPGPDLRFPDPTGAILAHGWDRSVGSPTAGQRATYRSPQTKDFMSYCSPAWISEYGYRSAIVVQQARGAAPARMAARAPTAVLHVRALLRADGTGEVHALHVARATLDDETNTGALVELLDARNTVIAQGRVAEYAISHSASYAVTGQVVLPAHGAPVTRIRIASDRGPVLVHLLRTPIAVDGALR
jgi:hypothetical protein